MPNILPSFWHHRHHQYHEIVFWVCVCVSRSQIFHSYYHLHPVVILFVVFFYMFVQCRSVSFFCSMVCLRLVLCEKKNITKIMTFVSLSVIINRIWHNRIHISLSMDINSVSDTHAPLIFFLAHTHRWIDIQRNMQTVCDTSANEIQCVSLSLHWFDVRGSHHISQMFSMFLLYFRSFF